MGSFKGHVLPGTVFVAVGLWHVWSALVRYASNPSAFRVRVWNPVPGFKGKLKYAELYFIAVGAFTDMCIEFLYSPHLKFFVDGTLNPSHMNDFEHAGMLLMFFLYGAIALLSEKTSFLPLPEGTLCLVAASAFCSEYLLFYFHSTSHKGLEGYYHLLLVFLIGFCVLSTVAAALIPRSFVVDLSTGIAMTLQGLWFYQTAFTLYGPMMPDGCKLNDNIVSCRSPETEIRGELLANFQLFSILSSLLVVVACAYSLAHSRYGHGDLSVAAAYVGLEED